RAERIGSEAAVGEAARPLATGQRVAVARENAEADERVVELVAERDDRRRRVFLVELDAGHLVVDLASDAGGGQLVLGGGRRRLGGGRFRGALALARPRVGGALLPRELAVRAVRRGIDPAFLVAIDLWTVARAEERGAHHAEVRRLAEPGAVRLRLAG